MNRKIAVALLLALIFIFAMGHPLTLYMIQENIVLLFVVFALMMAGLLLLVAFVLFQEGLRLGFQRLKAKLLRIAWFRGRQSARPEAGGRLSLRH